MGLGRRGIVLSKIVQILYFLIISVVKTKAADLRLCFPIDKRQVFSWRGFLAHLSRRLIGELIGYSWSGVRPASLSFTKLKDLPLQNHLANQSQILCGASLGRGNKSLFATSGSHDQDGCHAHIW